MNETWRRAGGRLRVPLVAGAVPLAVVAMIAATAVVGCNSVDPPKWFDEQPVASDAWTEISGPPGWVNAKPAVVDGKFTFVVEGKSNLRSIIAHGRSPHPDRELASLLRERLGPITDTGGVDPVDLAVTVATANLRMTRRVCSEEVLTTRMVPGNTLCTAWAMWETPVEPIVETLSPDRRDAARAALAK